MNVIKAPFADHYDDDDDDDKDDDNAATMLTMMMMMMMKLVRCQKQEGLLCERHKGSLR